ncbi:MAG: winged helix-turn-helix transcriptional regulator [Candidatus Woesearchaeota archaeon]
MGQQEVYDFLKANKNTWYTSREISEKLNISIGSVTMSLKKLRKSKLLDYENTGKRNMFRYRFKDS